MNTTKNRAEFREELVSFECHWGFIYAVTIFKRSTKGQLDFGIVQI